MRVFRRAVLMGLVLAGGCGRPDWTRGLGSADEKVRAQAIEEGAGRGRETVLPLVKALAEKPRSCRFILGSAGVFRRIGAAAGPALEKGLRDEDRAVRTWSLVAVGVIGGDHRDLAGRLLAGLEEPCMQAVAAHVKRVFTSPGDDRKLEILLHALRGREPPAPPRPAVAPDALAIEDTHVATALALLKIGPVHGAAFPGLKAALKSACPRVRIRAAEALGMPGLPVKEEVSALVAAVTDPDFRVRAAAALALAGMGDAALPARAVLGSLLQDNHDTVRLAAATALFRFGGEHPGEDLVKAIRVALRRRPLRSLDSGAIGAVRPDEVSCTGMRTLIEHVYGIEIVFAEDGMEHVVLQNLRYRPVDPTTHFFHLTALMQTLAFYPVPVIQQDLRSVWIVRQLAIPDGLGIGGTYDDARGAVVLAVPDTSVNTMAAGFHHEFSSILMRKHAFPHAAWRACNAPGFHHGRGGIVAIRKGQVAGGSPALYAQGFFEEYGRADLENDFNTFSEMMFTCPIKAMKLIKQYPRLRAKWKVWMDFYHRIHPAFNTRTLLGFEADE